MRLVCFLAAATATGATGAASSSLKFASSIGTNMVLQQAPQRSAVWGYTNSTAPVTVRLLAAGTSVPIATVAAVVAPVTGVPGAALSWKAVLPSRAAATGPGGVALAHTLVAAQGSSSINITNVLFGETWVCSGQSNMAFLLENTFNGSLLVQDANNWPEVRLFTTAKTTSAAPLLELLRVEQPWAIANNVSVSDDGSRVSVGAGAGAGLGVGDDNWLYMSAVCYLYGLGVHKALGVPVGLMNTNWGGTAIQDWSSAEAMAACTHKSSSDGDDQPPLRVATHLFNAMVSPLLNHSIAGVVWWQGESNGGAPVPYGCQMPALVADWRVKWHAASEGRTAADFPFGVVQLAGCPDDADSLGGVPIRVFQTGGSGVVPPAMHLPNALMPNTFLATAYDLGDATSPFGAVHIRYKQDVADRLVAAGLRQAYNQSTSYTGPVFARAEVAGVAGTGMEPAVTLYFNNTGAQGLALRAMNVSLAHPQTNWSGATPFEVCTAPGGGVDPRVTCAGAGALAAGEDLDVANMTLEAAVAWCTANASCAGLTARAGGGGGGCGATGVQKVYFKRAIEGRNTDADWVSFTKGTPCALMSRFDGWSQPAKTTVSADGRSVVLSGLPGPVAAVRFAWRSYPCEYKQCGLYSAAEHLPPPPFYAAIDA
eukprot:g222.t1